MWARNFAKRLAGLERDMAAYLEAEEARLSARREFTDAELVELLLVYHEIAAANQMSYPEALVRLLGLEPNEAETIAQQLGPLAEERMEQRIQLRNDSL